MKRGAMNHPKLLLLARRLALPLPHAVGILECLWHFTDLYTPDGRIGKYTPGIIAERIGFTGDPAELFSALLECRWLDPDPGGVIVHDWHEHCDDAVHMRLARAGKRFANGLTPKLTRLGPVERQRALERFAETPPEIRAHAVRNNDTPTASLPEPPNTSAPENQDFPSPPPPAEDCAHTVRGGAPRTLPPQLCVPAATLTLGELAAFMPALTGEHPRQAQWWARLFECMRDAGGTHIVHEGIQFIVDCADPARRALKNLAPLADPAKYLTEKCRSYLLHHGKKLPSTP